MRLDDPMYDATFVRLTDARGGHAYVDTLAEAQGIFMLCPRCLKDKGTNIGVHSILMWRANCGVPEEQTPGPGRWAFSGSGLDDLTLAGVNGHSDSIFIGPGGCEAHFYIRQGQVVEA